MTESTQSVAPPVDAPAPTFADFGLHPLLLQSIAETGYTIPTPIQAQAIPVVVEGRDVMGAAQTGTGKT
ncbi:MAG TPA: ATP-dependent RNA helicase, partial [Achromobacter sp.]|nr:ATP-dependent RNA helicase [Achromobacter sp.]